MSATIITSNASFSRLISRNRCVIYLYVSHNLTTSVRERLKPALQQLAPDSHEVLRLRVRNLHVVGCA